MLHHVDSEVGKLHKVLLHRPGLEMNRLTPSNKDDLLFDDVLWLEKAQEEHKGFVKTLEDRGIEVVLLDNLLTETVEIPEARQYLADQLFNDKIYGSLAEVLRGVVDDMTAREFATLMIAGMTKRELVEKIGDTTSVYLQTLELDDMILSPLPNHLFTRDTSCWVYDGVAVNSMQKPARRRETINLSAIYKWHPSFANDDFNLWTDGLGGPECAVEGGDVLIIGRGVVLVGMSERTTAVGVERLAKRLFANGSAKEIIALDMPKGRAVMHLDTVMTMANENTFSKYAGLGMLPSYSIYPGDNGGLDIVHHPAEEMHNVIAKALGEPEIHILTAPQDMLAAEREQWNDGCNMLTIAPGVVVTYERNVTTNAYFRKNGLEVLEVPGDELGRGRGGPRCMSCPMIRDGI